MQTEIEKLIKEYKRKISDKDIQINALNKTITKFRRDTTKDGLLIELRAERAIKEAQKQAYIQSDKDLDSLLDFI